MSSVHAALFRVLIVVLLTVLALMVAAPVSEQELRVTPATAPGVQAVPAHIEEGTP